MATLSYIGKRFNNIASLEFSYNKHAEALMIFMDGHREVLKLGDFIRIEVKGNVSGCCISNAGTVIGDIRGNCEVGNCMYIEGNIAGEALHSNIVVDMDPNIKVTYGPERIKREMVVDTYGAPYNKKQSVVHVEGNLAMLKSDSCGELVIFGNVLNMSVGNCLYLKGRVTNTARVAIGNRIYCTFGKSKGMSTNKVIKQREIDKRRLDSEISELFKSFNTRQDMQENF